MTARQARGGKKKWTTSDLPDGTQDAFSKRIVPYLREKVGQSVTPWAPLSVEDVQDALDVEFGRTEYCVAERGAWMGLVRCSYLSAIYNTLFTARPIIGSLTFVTTFALRRKKQLRHLSKNTAISSQHRSLLDNI